MYVKQYAHLRPAALSQGDVLCNSTSVSSINTLRTWGLSISLLLLHHFPWRTGKTLAFHYRVDFLSKQAEKERKKDEEEEEEEEKKKKRHEER